MIFVFSLLLGSFSLCTLELFALPIYYLRPRYFPCKGWKKVAAAYVILLLISANFCVFSEWLHEENINSLIKVEGILDYHLSHSSRGGASREYYLRNELNRRQSKDFKTLLCTIGDYDKFFEKYLSENMTVWYNGNGYIYQMQVGDEIIVNIDDANKKVFNGNLRHFDLWGFYVVLITAVCLAGLNGLNNNYKKDML